MMENDNDKWLDSLAGNLDGLVDEKELALAKKAGIRFRQSVKLDQADEEGLSQLIKRLENDNLLNTRNKQWFYKYWQYGVAAMFVLAISIPVVLLQEPVSTVDYPKIRGLVESQIITVHNPEKSAHEIQSILKSLGLASQIFKHNNNLIVSFTVEELTIELQKRLNQHSILLNKTGIHYIEYSKNK